MKKKILLIILVVSILLTGCKDKTKEEETATKEKVIEEYREESTISFDYDSFVL